MLNVLQDSSGMEMILGYKFFLKTSILNFTHVSFLFSHKRLLNSLFRGSMKDFVTFTHGYTIVNRGKWLRSLAKFFVLHICFLFALLAMTVHKTQ